jgi:hypothetical protein
VTRDADGKILAPAWAVVALVLGSALVGGFVMWGAMTAQVSGQCKLDLCAVPGIDCPPPDGGLQLTPLIWCCPWDATEDNPCVWTEAASDCAYSDTIVICEWGLQNGDGTVECFD